MKMLVSLRTPEEEIGGYLWIQSQPGIDSEFQANHSVTVYQKLKRRKKGRRRRKGDIFQYDLDSGSKAEWKEMRWWCVSLIIHEVFEFTYKIMIRCLVIWGKYKWLIANSLATLSEMDTKEIVVTGKISVKCYCTPFWTHKVCKLKKW